MSSAKMDSSLALVGLQLKQLRDQINGNRAPTSATLQAQLSRLAEIERTVQQCVPNEANKQLIAQYLAYCGTLRTGIEARFQHLSQSSKPPRPASASPNLSLSTLRVSSPVTVSPVHSPSASSTPSPAPLSSTPSPAPPSSAPSASPLSTGISDLKITVPSTQNSTFTPKVTLPGSNTSNASTPSPAAFGSSPFPSAFGSSPLPASGASSRTLSPSVPSLTPPVLPSPIRSPALSTGIPSPFKLSLSSPSFEDDLSRVIREVIVPRQGAEVKMRFNPNRHYQLGDSIYDTVCGTLYPGIERSSSRRVAVKQSSLRVLEEQKFYEDPLRETRILWHLNKTLGGHPNLIRLLDVACDQDCHWQVLEYVEHGDFTKYLNAKNRSLPLLEAEAKHFAVQLLSVLSFVHQAGYAHLDVSLENLLVDNADQIRLIDFGVAQPLSLDPITQQPAPLQILAGKAMYVAPEAGQGLPCDGPLADVFAVGVVVYLWLFGQWPFGPGVRAIDPAFRRIMEGELPQVLERLNLLESVSPAAVDFLNCTICREAQRSSIPQLLQHPWLN